MEPTAGFLLSSLQFHIPESRSSFEPRAWNYAMSQVFFQRDKSLEPDIRKAALEISFFRDRDLRTDSPGKLLMYHRFGGKRVKGFGHTYVHVFADMFNGFLWGQLSTRKGPEIGLKMLEKALAPRYFGSGYAIKSIMHSAHRAAELDGFADFYIKNQCAQMGIEWINTARRSDHVKCLNNALMSSPFYEQAVIGNIPFINLPYVFAQWLTQYNRSISQQPTALDFMPAIRLEEVLP